MGLFETAKSNAESFMITIKELINSASFNKSFRAIVTAKINNTVYKVSYKKAEYKVKSDYDLIVGDLVWVCAPQNNWDSLFVVSHKSNSLKNYDFREDGIYLDGVKITK